MALPALNFIRMSRSVSDGDTLLSSSLASYLDSKVLILLRDGRTFSGKLRSFDQFANVVLEDACERVTVEDVFSDIPLGLYVIRGENVVLIGQKDPEKPEFPEHIICVSETDIRKVQQVNKEAAHQRRKPMEFLDID